MWRGPLFLQVFASHLNGTASRFPSPELNSEDHSYQGAMALAAAAVCGIHLFIFLVLTTSSLNALLP
jgi:hypothetical protein